MPNINQWVAEPTKSDNWIEDIEGNNIAVNITHVLIQAKPSVIVIERGDEDLPEQTVRIEMTRIQPDVQVGPTARESRANVVLIGYKGHPTIPDTDIQKGDRFALNGIRYEVRLIFSENIGMVEAWLEQML